MKPAREDLNNGIKVSMVLSQALSMLQVFTQYSLTLNDIKESFVGKNGNKDYTS